MIRDPHNTGLLAMALPGPCVQLQQGHAGLLPRSGDDRQRADPRIHAPKLQPPHPHVNHPDALAHCPAPPPRSIQGAPGLTWGAAGLLPRDGDDRRDEGADPVPQAGASPHRLPAPDGGVLPGSSPNLRAQLEHRCRRWRWERHAWAASRRQEGVCMALLPGLMHAGLRLKGLQSWGWEGLGSAGSSVQVHGDV